MIMLIYAFAAAVASHGAAAMLIFMPLFSAAMRHAVCALWPPLRCCYYDFDSAAIYAASFFRYACFSIAIMMPPCFAGYADTLFRFIAFRLLPLCRADYGFHAASAMPYFDASCWLFIAAAFAIAATAAAPALFHYAHAAMPKIIDMPFSLSPC